MQIRSRKVSIYIDFKSIFLKISFMCLFPLVGIIEQTPHHMSMWSYTKSLFYSSDVIDYTIFFIWIALIIYFCRDCISISKN